MNDKLLHLVDDIFWHLGFKSAEHAEKVKRQIIDCCDYCNDCDYFRYFRSASTTKFPRLCGQPNAKILLMRYVIWVPITASNCETGGTRWVYYLAEKDAASGGLGQTTRADPNTQKRVVDDSE